MEVKAVGTRKWKLSRDVMSGMREGNCKSILEGGNYESRRARLIDSVVTAIGKEEWNRRLEEEDTATGYLYGVVRAI